MPAKDPVLRAKPAPAESRAHGITCETHATPRSSSGTPAHSLSRCARVPKGNRARFADPTGIRPAWSRLPCAGAHGRALYSAPLRGSSHGEDDEPRPLSDGIAAVE